MEGIETLLFLVSNIFLPWWTNKRPCPKAQITEISTNISVLELAVRMSRKKYLTPPVQN